MKLDSTKGNHLAIQTIFIADDDADDQMLFGQALQEIAPHISLEVIKDGNELLSLLQNFKPELLFLDLDMPFKNGLECLKSIKSNPSLADMAVIVYSSTSRPANIAVAYEMGADLFFMKPSSYLDLVNMLRNVLEINWADPVSIQEMKLNKNPFVVKSNEQENL